MIFILDMDTRHIRWCDEPTEKILGYSLSEIQAMDTNFFKTIMHPDDYLNGRSALESFSLGEKKYIGFYRLKGKHDPEWYWFYSTLSIYETNDKKHITSLLCNFCKIEPVDTPKNTVIIFNQLMMDSNHLWRDEFSDRQKAIIHLLKQGYRTKEIGKKLFIGSETVHAELKKLYERFNVHTAAALVAIMIETGYYFKKIPS